MACKARLVVLVTLSLAVLLFSGCVRFGMDLTVAPDGSTSARMTAGLDQSIEQMGEQTGNPFEELVSGEDAKRWQVREYTEGNWKMSEAVGHAGPGETLFADEEAPTLQVQTSQRRLTTRYMLTLAVPTPEGLPAPPSEEEAAELGEEVGQMVAGLMSGLELKFALTGPGRLVATTGQDMGRGRAEWKLGMKDLQGRLPDFKLTTEMPNWTNIGRLADQIATQHKLYEAGSELAAALERGLLPNPPANLEAEAKLSAGDYAKLLEIIARLDAALWPAATAKVMAQSGLSDDYVTPAQVQAAYDRLLKTNLGPLVETAAATAAAKALSGK